MNKKNKEVFKKGMKESEEKTKKVLGEIKPYLFWITVIICLIISIWGWCG